MQFNYLPIRNCRLTQDEENLLLDVDNFSYSIGTFQKLADLHCNLTVYTSAEKKTRDFSYVISASERQQKIDELNQKINDLSDEFDNLPLPGFNADKSVREAYVRKQDELGFEIWTSRKSLELYENASDLHNGNYQINGSYLILGEYDSSNKAITLYMNNIRGNGSNPELTAIVYVHEMMHAAFDCGTNNFIEEIEEPITEYAMLRFFDTFDKNVLEVAKIHVQHKKACPGTCYYGLGEALFSKYANFDWVKDYYDAKQTSYIPNNDSNIYVGTWGNGIYPFNSTAEANRVQLLYNALHSVHKKITPHIGQSNNPQNNNRSYVGTIYRTNHKHYFVFKNDALLWGFDTDNDLVTGFIQNYVNMEDLTNYKDINDIFNDYQIFNHFRQPIVSYDLNWTVRHIGAQSKTGIQYFIRSGQWDTKTNKRLQKFCDCVNNDMTVFRDYEIYILNPTTKALTRILSNTTI